MEGAPALIPKIFHRRITDNSFLTFYFSLKIVEDHICSTLKEEIQEPWYHGQVDSHYEQDTLYTGISRMMNITSLTTISSPELMITMTKRFIGVNKDDATTYAAMDTNDATTYATMENNTDTEPVVS